jgi:hypothetical protein
MPVRLILECLKKTIWYCGIGDVIFDVYIFLVYVYGVPNWKYHFCASSMPAISMWRRGVSLKSRFFPKHIWGAAAAMLCECV